MHTFFINTSDKNVDEGKILFDINYENRALVALKCRIEDWPDKEKGYLACVEKMSEMMDMYDDMNKRFNLIIYIDLSAMRKEALEQDTMANDYRGYMGSVEHRVLPGYEKHDNQRFGMPQPQPERNPDNVRYRRKKNLRC